MGRSLLLLSVFCAVFTVCFAIGNDNDSHDCLTSAGYTWCERIKSCVRPWELATQQNIQNTKESVELFCAYSTEKGNDADGHGCIKSAGYSWCQAENACVRPWELAKLKNLNFNEESFDLYCSSSSSSSSSSNNVIGGEINDKCLQSAGYLWCARENKCIRPWVLARQKNLSFSATTVATYCASSPSSSDNDFCLVSAGYSWCQKEGKCVRPFELGLEKNIKFTAESFAAYCSVPIAGSDKDNHNCLASAGYSWCQAENACVRPWELGTQKNIKFTAESFAAYCSGPIAGSDKDTHNCIASAGYSWCEKENACVRPWELGKLKNIQFTAESFAAYCSGSVVGSDEDTHNCLASAGYSWCQAENACVRPWELGKLKNIKFTPETFAAYCSGSVVGSEEDTHNCLASAGYSWCQAENACVRPWELGKLKNIKFTPESFAAYCSGSVAGSDKDENGCIASAGYTWCQRLNSCVRPWELAKAQNIDSSLESISSFCNSTAMPKGGDADTHNCLASAGYSWCQAENACVRPWELGKLKNIKFTPETFAAYCAGTSSSVKGGDEDTHGCLASAGYTWCQAENACVRPWELGKEKNIKFTPEIFAAYCSRTSSSSNVEGGEVDAHGCLTSAGYSFCQRLNSCVRPWELAKEQNIGFTSDEFNAYCNTEEVGGEVDEHGCIVAAGYMWCDRENGCVRPWQLALMKNIEFSRAAVSAYCSSAADSNVEGGEKDTHGCLTSAGYSWCQREGACVRPWELATKIGQDDINTATGFDAYCESMIV